MARIQKEEVKRILSDWETDDWTKEMYQAHERDFQEILREYREIKKTDSNVVSARNIWLQRKGALKIRQGSFGSVDLHAVESTYNLYSRMFDRFILWLSQKERRDMSPEVIREAIRVMGEGINTRNFGIPKEVREVAERDLEHDEMKQDALEKF